MRQDVQADDRRRRADVVGGSEVGAFSAALAWIGAVVLLAAIAFILGATLLT